MRTVSALTLEGQRFKDYENALLSSEPHFRFDAFMGGVTSGLSMFVQQWINVSGLRVGCYGRVVAFDSPTSGPSTLVWWLLALQLP